MTWRTQNKGFTIIELLIVMGLAALMLSLSAPLVNSLEPEIKMEATIKQIKQDLISTLHYAMAGKSFGAIKGQNIENPSQLPFAYLLHFQSNNDFGDPIPYRYLELTQNENGSMEWIYQKEHPYPNTHVFLKEIRLTQNESEKSETVSSAYIGFIPPFAKVFFIDAGPEFTPANTDELFKDQEKFDQIELIFQYKENEGGQVSLNFDVSKTLLIKKRLASSE